MIPHHQSGFRRKVSDSISVHCFGVKLGLFFFASVRMSRLQNRKEKMPDTTRI